MRRWIFFYALVLPGLVVGSTQAQMTLAEPGWLELWGQMLARHTRSVDSEVGTRVDYRSLSLDPIWSQTLSGLEAFDPLVLETRDEKLAFWVNAYNILAMDLVIQNYPTKSIRDLGSWFRPVWKKSAGTINGRSYSLDEIEHEILRPMKDPRIHGAIVCASISCPNLLRQPYRAQTVGAQLDESLRAWMRRPEKGMALDREAKALKVSRVFDWFSDDFDPAGGVIPFVARYAPPEDGAWLRENGDQVSLSYFAYDWNLND